MPLLKLLLCRHMGVAVKELNISELSIEKERQQRMFSNGAVTL